MNLNIEKKYFLVTGATSGLGGGTAKALLNEGAHVIAVARKEEGLKELGMSYPGQVIPFAGDMFIPEQVAALADFVSGYDLSGAVINAGGPPAGGAMDVTMDDWDAAWLKVVRWKVDLVSRLVPGFIWKKYGRILFIESVSVKQPVARLVLSNSLRMAVAGYAKTLSQELAGNGVTVNVMAPGFHHTPAAERLFVKRAEIEKISVEEAKARYEREIPAGRMGDTGEFGMLAAWILSPYSGYITGEVFPVDGGTILFTLG
ncbi:MAG: SDR family oxidoreductase [Bacteroidales bacterium]